VALMERDRVIIIGAGPAGLTAAYELARRGIRPIVLEKADQVGGLSRTETHKGYRLDVGGHRFFTKVKAVQDLWEETIGEDFLKVPRLSRIYYNNRFFSYPINFFNTLSNLGVIESLAILLSYLRAQLQPDPEGGTFEKWVINRFGQRLYETFFKTYTEKVWGIPCHMIQADWAAQRIKGLSLRTAVSHALFGSNRHQAKTLINEFHYPVLGPGMMWQRFKERIEAHGGEILLNTEVIGFKWGAHRLKRVVLRQGEKIEEISGDHYISTVPLIDLISKLDPSAPEEAAVAARNLAYRAFILVGVILNQAKLFPDNWIYVHSPEVRVGRIQNFGNWSTAMVPDPKKTSLGMEYFCTEGDALWTMSDAGLIDLAKEELRRLGLANGARVEEGVVLRQAKAYPVYDKDYHLRLQVIQQFLRTIDNLQTIGRNGLHRYNNQDHSMLTAMLAVRNVMGENHDLWRVNTEQSYHE
jgi:protoporphyrinogen oxidase